MKWSTPRAKAVRLTTGELTRFAMLGTVLFCSKLIMEVAPNIHLLGMFVMTYTVVYRRKALIPLYLYVLIQGIYAGFAPWWVPYLYLWTILWGVTMLLPRNLSRRQAMVVYPVVCSLHGFLYGVLYAPGQALLFGLNFEQTLAWIAAGLPFALIPGVSTLVACMLVLPMSDVLLRLEKQLN